MKTPTRPYQSKLNPYRSLIEELRAVFPPTSYERIAQILKERHGLDVTGNSVWSFCRVRSKFKQVLLARVFSKTPPKPQTKKWTIPEL